jgi:hypothetical protein
VAQDRLVVLLVCHAKSPLSSQVCHWMPSIGRSTQPRAATQPRIMSAHLTSSIQSAGGATDVSPLRKRWGRVHQPKIRQPQRGGSPKSSAAWLATSPLWKARIGMAHPCQKQTRKGRPPQRCLGRATRPGTKNRNLGHPSTG